MQPLPQDVATSAPFKNCDIRKLKKNDEMMAIHEKRKHKFMTNGGNSYTLHMEKSIFEYGYITLRNAIMNESRNR